MPFGRLPSRPVARPLSDINVTPLVDVMLVLLVIFMLTAPLLGSAIRLKLPQAASTQAPPQAPTLVLSLDAQGHTYLNQQRLEPGKLQQHLQGHARSAPDTEVQLQADQNIPYGQVATLMGLIRQSGLTHIALTAHPLAPPTTSPPTP